MKPNKKLKRLDDDLKFDPELTRLSYEFIKECEEAKRCPECGWMRYMSNCFFCSNPNCISNVQKQ